MRLHPEQEAEFLELDAAEGLGEDVGDHVVGAAVMDDDIAAFGGLANKMKANVDVLGASVKRGVLREANGALVVTVDRGGLRRRLVQVRKELACPQDVLGEVRERDVLRLGA